MSYLIGILVLAVVLGASAAMVLIALARLVEVLPPPSTHAEDEEDTSTARLPAERTGGPLLR
jgi:hypothetical protein